MNAVTETSFLKSIHPVHIAEKDKLRQVPISEINLSGYNNLIYRPASADDPAIKELANSIRETGILEPLVLTTDGCLLSGHRRLAACMLLGLSEVPVRYDGIASDSPDFLKRLREHNRQRQKGIDEVIREQVLDSCNGDTDSIVEKILIDRYNREPEIDSNIDDGDYKERAQFSKGKYQFINAVCNIINDLHKFWPLSDRQIHYQLLNDPPLRHSKKPQSRYKNDTASYKDLCNLLTRGRLNRIIPWSSINDQTRPIATWKVYPNVEPFIKESLDDFLDGYYRDYQKSQPHHIEIVGEKNTIEGTIRPIASRYRIPYTIGRGYCSLSPRYELVKRFEESKKEKLILLILSDLDPDGEEIAESFVRSIKGDFRINDVDAVKVAVTMKQVDDYDLQSFMKAKDKKSSRREKFIKKHGEDVYELEAIAPDELRNILQEAIQSVMDVDLLNNEMKQEKADLTSLVEKKKQYLELIAKSEGKT